MTDGPKDKTPLSLLKEPRIVVTVTTAMEEMLSELVKTGLYGTSPADAARRLIERGLEDALANHGGEPE